MMTIEDVKRVREETEPEPAQKLYTLGCLGISVFVWLLLIGMVYGIERMK